MYYLQVLTPLNFKRSPNFRFPLPDSSLPEKVTNSMAITGKKVGLFIGAGHPGRKWPEERFAELAARLIGDQQAHILVILGPEEQPLEESVKRRFPPSVQIVKDLSLRELLRLISGLDLFVGNDTGPSHLASMIGTSTIMIMRSDYDRRFTPLGDNTIFVASGPIDEITVDEAFSAARSILEDKH
jgi:ADP-heptose:LPS heptosyltransferase